MRRPNRLAEPGESRGLWLVALLALAFLAAVGLVVVLGFVAAPKSDPSTIASSPQERFSWPVFGIGMAVLVLVVVGAILAIVLPRRSRSRVDASARYMSTRKDLDGLSEAKQRADAERLGVTDVGSGVPIGQMVNGGSVLTSSYEHVRIAILGPRAGKTSSVAIREVMETNGPSIVTSNKRDIVDATRGPRSERGLVRVYDIQNLVGEKPTWWWNPLSFVHNLETAERLAGIFVASATGRDAKTDAYFSAAAKDYLSALLLAAAVGNQPLSILITWMARPDTGEPVNILSMADYVDVARTLRATLDLTPKQRDGVIGTAQPFVAFLRNPEYLPWIQQTGPDDDRPHFDPEKFVKSKADTLYLVSKEGEGSARAITAALTMATLDAADRLGAASPGMRVPRPIMATLDEAANVVRWPELPDLYSHYGSRGIILSVFLQSWTQGVEAWTEGGMKKMWSAANIRMVGAGVAEVGFLRELAELVGKRDVRSSSLSTSMRSGSSTSTSLRREEILDVSEIGSLPPGRALVFSSGNPPALVKLIPWWTREYADSVAASRDYFEKNEGSKNS